MDWRDKLIKLYLFSERYYNSSLYIHNQRFSNNAKPDFTDVEVITVYLWGITRGFGQVARIYRYTSDHLGAWFPKLPSCSTYVTRLNALCSVFQAWLERLREDFPLLKELKPVALVDSTPVIMARGSRRYTAKVAMELASSGYCPGKKLHYHGVKPDFIAIKRDGELPVPDYPGVGPADEHDLNTLKQLAHILHDKEIYADKAYVDSWSEFLLKQRDAGLITPIKRKGRAIFNAV